MWSKLKQRLFPSKLKESLTEDMCTEIDRLEIDREWIQKIVDDGGLEFGRFFISQRTKESQLFDRWFPHLRQFADSKRSQHPFPDPESLNPLDAATKRILDPKIRDAEHVPTRDRFIAAIFTAPLHVLPTVMSEWPSSYKNTIYLTPEELEEWRAIYDAEEPDKDSWWFVFQWWEAQLNPPPDSFWLQHVPPQQSTELTRVLIITGLSWGSLQGGENIEFCEIDRNGQISPLQSLGDTTF